MNALLKIIIVDNPYTPMGISMIINQPHFKKPLGFQVRIIPDNGNLDKCQLLTNYTIKEQKINHFALKQLQDVPVHRAR
ncbi:MAG: hypothetical protein P4L59_07655 [Desulfosporosinus sp.]|nr:hypothetical protein [Desulfosporosinus sp.]